MSGDGLLSSNGLRPSDDVELAAWIAPKLGTILGSAGLVIPVRFAAYARILHPVRNDTGEWTTWSAVAEAKGVAPDATMRWHRLMGSDDPSDVPGASWEYGDPELGNLLPRALVPLTTLLAEHTGTPDRCWFCIWEGHGWLWAGHGLRHHDSDGVEPAFLMDHERFGRRVHLPNRDYLLCTGPVTAALTISDRLGESVWPKSPNLWWPADRAWCVASEIDHQATVVGGSSALIEAIVRYPDLEAFAVHPDDWVA